MLVPGWLRPPLNIGLRPSINSQRHLPPTCSGVSTQVRLAALNANLKNQVMRYLKCDVEIREALAGIPIRNSLGRRSTDCQQEVASRRALEVG